MTLIRTCQLCSANSFDYLIDLQRHARELANQPIEVAALELPRDAGAGRSGRRHTSSYVAPGAARTDTVHCSAQLAGRLDEMTAYLTPRRRRVPSFAYKRSLRMFAERTQFVETRLMKYRDSPLLEVLRSTQVFMSAEGTPSTHRICIRFQAYATVEPNPQLQAHAPRNQNRFSGSFPDLENAGRFDERPPRSPGCIVAGPERCGVMPGVTNK